MVFGCIGDWTYWCIVCGGIYTYNMIHTYTYRTASMDFRMTSNNGKHIYLNTIQQTAKIVYLALSELLCISVHQVTQTYAMQERARR